MSAIDAAQVGGLGAGALDPALDEAGGAGAAGEGADREHPVVHAPARRSDRPRASDASRSLSARSARPLEQRRRLVVEELDRGAEIGRLARRVGDRRHVVEVEPLRRQHLRLDEHAVVARVLAVADAGLVGGEHHRDRHQRQAIDGPPVEQGQHPFAPGHRPARPPERLRARATAADAFSA